MIDIEFINAFNELFAFVWKLTRLWSNMSAARFREPKNEVEERSLPAEVTPKAILSTTRSGQGKFSRIGSKTEVTRTHRWNQSVMRA